MTSSSTTLGISTTTTLYGWDTLFYGPDRYLVVAARDQLSVYASPYWYERLSGNDKDNTLFVGGFYTTENYTVGSGSNSIALTPFTANFINGGKGYDWISFTNFTALANATTIGYAAHFNPTDPRQAAPATTGNHYIDLGATTNPADPYFLQTSLIAGDGQALPIFGMPGVVVNLSNVALDRALAPLLRVDDPARGIENYGLVSGLSDYLSARLIEAGALNGQNGNNLFGPSGLGADQYAFLARDGSANYAIGQVVNVENVRGSSEASNVIVGGETKSILEGGAKADILIDGCGSNTLYGKGGNDLLVATSGYAKLYAGQFRDWKYTPSDAYVTDPYLLSLYESTNPADRDRLASLTATTFVGGTGKTTMVGSDAGNDYFLLGSYGYKIWGSGLGAKAEFGWSDDDDEDDDYEVDIDDHDTLSFAQIGTRYFEGYKNLTITVAYKDLGRQSGKVYVTYEKYAGKMQNLLKCYFYDIEHIVFGNTKTVFTDPLGVFYPETIDSGYSGGDPGIYNTTSGLIDPSPATSTVTGNNPAGGNFLNAGGGGNTNFNGGTGGNNTLDFSSGRGALYYDCTDQDGRTGHIRNYSLVIDLGNQRYSYQQDIDGTPTVYGGSVANVQTVVGTFDCNDILVGKSDTIALTGSGGTHNILFGGGGTSGGVGTRLKASRNTVMPSTPAHSPQAMAVSTTAEETMPNGGDGYHWVVFQNPVDLINGGNGYRNGTTTFSGPNVGGGRSDDVYGSVGIDADLESDTYSDRAPSGPSGEMIGFANILGTAGNDKLTGNANINILAGGDGDDSIDGGSGNDDVLYGGAGSNELIGVGFDVADSNVEHETFVVGYNYNPVAAGAYSSDGNYGVRIPAVSTNDNRDGEVIARIPGGVLDVGVITVATADKAKDDVWGWNTGVNAGDGLYVSNKGKATIKGFDGDVGYTLDFRQAQNLGFIDVKLGNGKNLVYGSTNLAGVFEPVKVTNVETSDLNALASPVLDAHLVGRDKIVTGSDDDEIHSGDGDDVIFADAGNNLINSGDGDNLITALGGHDQVTSGDGDSLIQVAEGANTVTAGHGNNIVSSGNGNDRIALGWGNNEVYAGGGVNTITLRNGSGSGGQNDVYINQFNTRNDISGFNADSDKIHLDADMLAAYGINVNGGSFIYNDFLYSDDEPRAGQAFGVGRVEAGGFSFTGEVYRAAYNSVLYVTGQTLYSDPNVYPNPWVPPSNGAYTNFDHNYAYGSGVAAGAGLTYGVYGLGIGLSFIPFVGPFIAAPILAIAGVMAFELSPAGGTQQHKNPIYQGFDSGLLGTDLKTLGASIPADWTQTSFTSFYNAPNDGFKPSLEVVGTGGIATVALLHVGNSATYIYLVKSTDNLIQNDETLLLARVNGFVSASDLALFDSEDPQHAAYAGGSSTTILKPAKAELSFTATAPAQVVVSAETATNALTNTTTPTAVVNFDAALMVGDSVTLRITRASGTIEVVRKVVSGEPGSDEIAVGTESMLVDFASLEPPLSLSSGETISVSVTVENSVGFLTESDIYTLSLDTKAPSLTIDPLATEVQFSSNETATLTLYAGTTPVTLDGSTASYALKAEQAFAAAGSLGTDRANPLWIDHYRIEDALGNSATLSAGADALPLIALPKIGLGTANDDALNAATAGDPTWNAALYGLDGDDSLSGGSGANRFYGGDGSDSITVAAGSDSNLIWGDAGGDSLNLTAIHDSAVVLVAGAVGSDSDSYAGQTALADDFDTIDGFRSSRDRLTVVLTDLGDFISAEDVSIEAPIPPATGATIVEVDVDSDGSLGERGDIYLAFSDEAPSQEDIAFNLTAKQDGLSHKLSGGNADDVIVGSDNDDTLTGGDGMDILTGGKGRDQLSGGTGHDRFIFKKLDSSTTDSSCDWITDFSSGDKIDLSDISTAFNLASGSATSSAGAGISFSGGFDAFTYEDIASSTTYLVYETTATTEGSTATVPGSLEMIKVALVAGLTVNNGLFSL